MHVLHLLSNRKWTERAEPAADLALAQAAIGLRSTFACTRREPAQPADHAVETRARRKGLEPFLLDSGKHISLAKLFRDTPRLRALVAEQGVSVLHAHMENAHLLAAWVARGCSPRPLVVRSSYETEGPRPGLRARLLMRGYTDGLVVISRAAREAALARFRFPAERIAVIEPGIDLACFDPARAIDQADRTSFGLPEHAIVVGVLSRLRADRRVDLVVRAVHAARARHRDLHLLICGHGESEADLRALAASLDGGSWVTFAGYCRGDRLPAAFRVMDILAYPAHGTDQSCRTVREALASGTPVMATPTGFAAELVDPARTGWLPEGTVDAWTAALERAADDRAALREMRGACLAEARRRFDLRLQAERTRAFYEALRRDPARG